MLNNLLNVINSFSFLHSRNEERKKEIKIDSEKEVKRKMKKRESVHRSKF